MNRLQLLLGRLGRQSTGAAIVLVGLAARLLYLFFIAGQPLVSDAASYTEMAANLAIGRHFVPFWPPGLPLYLAAVSSAFGGSALVMRLAMLPFYLGLCFALYRTVLNLTSEVACANLALLPLAFAPGMIFASVEPATEMPTAMLLSLVACFLIGVKAGKPGFAPLELGIAIGSLALLRPASLILLPFALLYLAWRAKSRWAGLAVCLIPVLMVGAWIAYVHASTGKLVMINTANAENLYLGNNPQTPLYRTWWLGSHHEHEPEALSSSAGAASDPAAQQARLSSLAWSYIGAHPGLFLLRTFNRICVFFALDTFAGAYVIENYGFPRVLGLLVVALDSAIYFILAIGSILYLATLPKREERASVFTDRWVHAFLLLAICVLYASPYFIAFSHPRYHFPLEPLLMAACAALALPFLKGEPQQALRSLGARKFGVAAAVALFLAVQVEFVVIVARALRG